MCQLNHNRRNIGCHQEAESQGFRLTHGQHLFVVGKLLSLNNVTARAVLCCVAWGGRAGKEESVGQPVVCGERGKDLYSNVYVWCWLGIRCVSGRGM